MICAPYSSGGSFFFYTSSRKYLEVWCYFFMRKKIHRASKCVGVRGKIWLGWSWCRCLQDFQGTSLCFNGELCFDCLSWFLFDHASNNNKFVSYQNSDAGRTLQKWFSWVPISEVTWGNRFVANRGNWSGANFGPYWSFWSITLALVASKLHPKAALYSEIWGDCLGISNIILKLKIKAIIQVYHNYQHDCLVFGTTRCFHPWSWE